MLIDAVEPRDIVALRDAMLRTRKYKPSTINGCLRLLRTMFREAVFELSARGASPSAPWASGVQGNA